MVAKLKDDAEFLEKLKGAEDLDAAVAMAKEAGFDVSKADWLRYQVRQTLELSDEALEGLAGCVLSDRCDITGAWVIHCRPNILSYVILSSVSPLRPCKHRFFIDPYAPRRLKNRI